MEERLVQALSERIRALREASPWSQEDFAAHAGLDRSYYARLERGRLNPSWVMIVRVAAGLDLQPSKLIENLDFEIDQVARDATADARGPWGTGAAKHAVKQNGGRAAGLGWRPDDRQG